jgi:hypothetical protein
MRRTLLAGLALVSLVAGAVKAQTYEYNLTVKGAELSVYLPLTFSAPLSATPEEPISFGIGTLNGRPIIALPANVEFSDELVYGSGPDSFYGTQIDDFAIETAATTINLVAFGTNDIDALGSIFSGGQDDDVIVSVSVPEPATWAMLIVGLGLTGATLRRRQQLAYATRKA